MSTTGPGGARGNGHKHRGSELLTVDELINRIATKARSRGGRLFLTMSALVVAAIIVVIPLTRSAPAYSPAATQPIAIDPASVVVPAPAQTTLPTLPLGLFESHTPTPLSSAPTTTSSSSTSSSTTTTSASTTTVPTTTVPPWSTPQTAPPPGPPDTGIQVPVG